MRERLPVALLVVLILALVPAAPGGRAQPASADADGTRLLRQPTVSDSLIAFAYANDIWVVPRSGGDARRLTSFRGTESHPHFSPDGDRVAFTAEYAGDPEVYVVGVEGGAPRRLTWHPGGDEVRGWGPDGESVVFVSARKSAPPSYARFFRVPVDGGLPEALPIPRGAAGSYSPDGTRFAYQPVGLSDRHWRNYRGGQSRPVWVLDMTDYGLEKLPGEGRSRNIDPVWMGDTIYFLSDRDLAMNLYAYDTGAGELSQLTRHSTFGVMNLDAGGGAVVYEQAGYIHLLDPSDGSSRRVDVRVQGDFPWAREHWEDVGDMITDASLSPTGVRALFQARGEIFTMPAEEGDWRNLTDASGSAERTPAWSPDGAKVAWFSDRGGEYELVISGQKGLEPTRRIELEDPSFYYDLQWAPDGRRVLFTDAARRLWIVDTETGDRTLVDRDGYTTPARSMDPAWSPDSDWIAYAKRTDSQYRVIMAYSVERDTAVRITRGMADAVAPTWDPSGDYLYFAASTDYGLNTGWLDMSSYDRPLTRGLYLAVLERGVASPLRPRSDEEPVSDTAAGGGSAAGSEAQESGEEPAAPEVTVDPEGIERRIVALDVPEANYTDLQAGDEGELFYVESPQPLTVREGPPAGTLHRYSLEEREASAFMEGVTSYDVSHDGSSLLYRSRGQWGVVPTRDGAEPGQGALPTDELRVRVDPELEWRQIFREAWRFERDFFYVDNMHGADWPAVRERYAPWVEDVRHRSDLTYLMDVMAGELSVGHSFTFGGDEPDVDEVPVGLLGADLRASNGRYRIERIYSGGPWSPDVRAPLTEPGVDVSEGDYLLAVDGRELETPTNPYRLLDGTAGRQTTLTVNDGPTMEGARRVTVVPVRSESELRRRAWVEHNRAVVDSLSDGRLGYVYVPNTSVAGYEYFNRYFFPQQDRQGVVIDERFNSGGSAADYMIEVLSRRLMGFFNNPTNPEKPFTLPEAGVWGPKVMIINEQAGSGGDLLPYMFRDRDIGPLVGRRTWGGLVGIWDTPSFVDGGSITAPRGGFYDRRGEWDVENEGVAPDVRVEQTPREVIRGGDPQLERAVDEALRLLETRDWPRVLPQPEPPVRVKRPGGESGGDG